MTQSLHGTELRTRDRPSAFWASVDHYTHLFLELRAALPPEQAEAVEAVLTGPFYDGPYKVSGAATQPIPPQSPRRQHKARKPLPDGLKTAERAAAKLGCSIKTLNAHVAAGDLRYVSIGKGTKRLRRMYADTDLDEFITNQTRKDVPCPSTRTETVARRTSISTSKCEVIGFTARRNARRAAKPKK